MARLDVCHVLTRFVSCRLPLRGAVPFASFISRAFGVTVSVVLLLVLVLVLALVLFLRQGMQRYSQDFRFTVWDNIFVYGVVSQKLEVHENMIPYCLYSRTC